MAEWTPTYQQSLILKNPDIAVSGMAALKRKIAKASSTAAINRVHAV